VFRQDFFLGAVNLHLFEPWRGESAEPAAGNGQQIRMLGGDQRTDEMKRCLGQGLERFGAVVTFVEDQRDVITGLDQIPVVGGQVFGDGTELDAVVDIAGVDAVKQWDVKIGAHQQAQ